MRKQFFAVTIVTAIAHASGFLKLWLVARIFGVGSDVDAYNLALVLPTFVAGIVSGVLQTALFPVRARLFATQSSDVVNRFERSVLVGLISAGFAIAVPLMLIPSAVAGMVGVNAGPDVQAKVAYVLPIALALIPLNAIGDGFSYLLAFRGRYHWAAAAPIGNALLGAALLYAWPQGGLLNLALGTTLGVALQVLLCAIALSRSGFQLFGPTGRRAEVVAAFKDFIQLAGWGLPGVCFVNLTATLPAVFAASHGEGTVSAFGYAWRLHSFGVQLLIMAASPVLLARFSTLIASGAQTTVRELVSRSLKLSILIGVAAALCVWFGGARILTIAFGGRFNATAVAAVTAQWQCLSLSFGPSIFAIVLTKLWQAQGQAKLFSLLSGLALFAFLLVEVTLSSTLGALSVGTAVAASAIIFTCTGAFIVLTSPISSVHNAR